MRCFITLALVAVSYVEVSFSHARSLTRGAMSGLTDAKDSEMPKILIYITTHMSEHHKEFLKHCWPLALKNSYLLNSSDVLLYMTPEPGQVRESVEIVKETFKVQQNFTYHITNNLGYQGGAIAALRDASRNGWFHNYDWVIRLNPDVIIQNDKWLLHNMKNNKNAKLLYVSCRTAQYPEVRGVHTDFFALKVADEPINFDFVLTGKDNAEQNFSDKVNHIILHRQHMPVLNVYPLTEGHCRVDGNSNGPVFHFHIITVENGICPAKFY